MSDTTRKLATIVALDVAGYSARTEADEARTTAEVAALRKVIEGIAAKHGGRVFNTAGDGFMLEFGSSLAGVEAAFELAETCEPKVRVGVHLGDVAVQPNGDLLGHGVNVAARLMARSDPGGALVSADVRRTIRGKLGERLVSRGMMKLDKMAETIEAFAMAAAAIAAKDVFLSYARQDQATAQKFAHALEREGFGVWWDAALRSGEAYDEVMEAALKSARAVIVLWSKNSVESRWVRAEATHADRNKTLVPAMIEACERPIMFELTQTADLSHWDGSADDRAWQDFLADLGKVAKATRPLDQAALRSQPVVSGAAAPSTPPGKVVKGVRPTLAVLPFTNRSGLKEDDIFAIGMVEDVVGALSLSRTMRVLAAASTIAYRNNSADVAQIGNQLGVRYLMEGNVRRVGESLRVTAQLIEAANGAILWTQKFDRPLSELASLQEELVTEVAANLGTQIQRIEIERALRKPGDLNAWEAMTRAAMATGRGNWPVAVAEAERAVALAPDSASAHAMLSFALSGNVSRGSNDPAWMIRGQKHIDRALELDAARPSVLLWVGWALAWFGKPEEGIGYIEQASELNPNDAVALLGLGAVYAMLNRLREAKAALRAHDVLSPNSPYRFNALIWDTMIAMKEENFGAAMAALDESLRRMPNFPAALSMKAMVCELMEQHEQARDCVRRLKAADPTYGYDEVERSMAVFFRNHPIAPRVRESLAKAWEGLG